MGNCFAPAFETGSVIGRQIALKIGLDVFTTTLDTACCSPMTALRMALWVLRLGEYQAALVIGVEAMSRILHISRQLRAGVRIGEVKLNDPIFSIHLRRLQPGGGGRLQRGREVRDFPPDAGRHEHQLPP